MRAALLSLLLFGSLAMSAFMLMWAVQTVWLGSFPGRDVEHYRTQLFWQLVAAGAFLAIAVFIVVRYVLQRARGKRPR